MSSIKLFHLNPVAPVELKPVALEKEIQTLVEQNMETFFGVRLLDSEHSISHANDFGIQNGRIDSLGIDEDYCPVIFEYKRDSNESVISQGLFYLEWLLNHKDEFRWLVQKKLVDTEIDKKAVAKLNFDNVLVYCVANSFGKYDPAAVRIIGKNIRLVRYAKGDSCIALDFLNSPSTGVPKKDVFCVEREWRFNTSYRVAGEPITSIVDEIRHYMLSLGDDVSEHFLQTYLAIKKIRNIVCVKIGAAKVTLYLQLDPAKYMADECYQELVQNNRIRDVSSIGHNGTGNLECTIETPEQLEAIKPLLEAAYMEN